MPNIVPEEERSHGTISNTTYFKYIQEGGNTVLTVILVLVFILAEVTPLNICYLLKYEILNLLLFRVALLLPIGGCQTGKE